MRLKTKLTKNSKENKRGKAQTEKPTTVSGRLSFQENHHHKENNKYTYICIYKYIHFNPKYIRSHFRK